MTFPSYVELEKRSTQRYAWASFWSTLIYSLAFLTTGICAVLLFGSDVKADFLTNLGTRSGTISVFIRATYCLCLLFHIPYFTLTIKEYILVLYDEIINRSLSTHLENKLAAFYQEEESKPETEKKNLDEPTDAKHQETPMPEESSLETDNLLSKEKDDDIKS